MNKRKLYYINPLPLVLGFGILVFIYFEIFVLNNIVIYLLLIGGIIWFLLSVQNLTLTRRKLVLRNIFFIKCRIEFDSFYHKENTVYFLQGAKVYSIFLDEGFDFSSLKIHLENKKQIEIAQNAEVIFNAIRVYYNTKYLLNES